MNERIRTLAIAAKQYAIEQKAHKGIESLFMHDDFVDKFSELIIRECIKVGCNAMYNDHSKVQTFPSKAIKDHFGVN